MRNTRVSLRRSLYPLIVGSSFGALLLGHFLFGIELRVLSAVCLLLTSLAVHLLEQKFPYRAEWNRDHGDLWSDFRFTLIYFPVTVFFCQSMVGLVPNESKLINLSAAPFFLQFAVCLLLGEFLFYWFHRLCHENKFLWRLHEKHHSVERVYWMNAGTFNLLDLTLNFLFYCLPAALIQFDGNVLECILFFSAVTGLMEHANIHFEASGLNYLLNTAELHRWHHSVVVTESKTNYGKALSVYDFVFRSFKYSPKTHVQKVGVEP